MGDGGICQIDFSSCDKKSYSGEEKGTDLKYCKAKMALEEISLNSEN